MRSPDQPLGKLIICYNCPEFLEVKLTQHGFKAYQPQELELLMANTNMTDVTTVTADGGTGNKIFYSTSGFVKQ